jgi:glycosyltransferase involved in cell wall biosynthesis
MLSVITPVLNGERFVRGCLENVLDQRCSRLEHLVVDGGSTDETATIVRDYTRRYPTIRWISEPGMGQSRAMNVGLAQCRGDIVGFLNVDDFYEDGAVSEVLELFESLPAPGLLVGNCNAWRDDTLAYVNRPRELRLEKLLLGPDFHQFPFNPSAYFCHKELHELTGPYDEADDYTMDLDFLLRAVAVAHVKYVDRTWGNFRVHPDAKTVRDREDGSHDVRRARVLARHRRTLPLSKRLAIRVEIAARVAIRWARRLRWRLFGQLPPRGARPAGWRES